MTSQIWADGPGALCLAVVQITSAALAQAASTATTTATTTTDAPVVVDETTVEAPSAVEETSTEAPNAVEETIAEAAEETTAEAPSGVEETRAEAQGAAEDVGTRRPIVGGEYGRNAQPEAAAGAELCAMCPRCRALRGPGCHSLEDSQVQASSRRGKGKVGFAHIQVDIDQTLGLMSTRCASGSTDFGLGSRPIRCFPWYTFRLNFANCEPGATTSELVQAEPGCVSADLCWVSPPSG